MPGDGDLLRGVNAQHSDCACALPHHTARATPSHCARAALLLSRARRTSRTSIDRRGAWRYARGTHRCSITRCAERHHSACAAGTSLLLHFCLLSINTVPPLTSLIPTLHTYLRQKNGIIDATTGASRAAEDGDNCATVPFLLRTRTSYLVVTLRRKHASRWFVYAQFAVARAAPASCSSSRGRSTRRATGDCSDVVDVTQRRLLRDIRTESRQHCLAANGRRTTPRLTYVPTGEGM